MADAAHLERDDWPWLGALLLTGCLTLASFWLVIYRFTDGQGGVPLDDAWIHFQFARNLARGDGFSFNPGQPTAGSTAPLWTLLLAAVIRAGGSFPVAGQLLSSAGFLGTLAATYALTKRLTGHRWAAWLAGTVVATNGRMVWAGLSALETCFFTALTLLAIDAHLADRSARRYRVGTAALFGLAALSRPEGYLLFALAMVDFVISLATRREKPWRAAWSRLPLLPTLVFFAFVLPYLIFSLLTSGHLLPNTYHAKATIGLHPDLNFVSAAAQYLILDNPLLLPFLVLGVGVLLRRAPLLSLWSVGLPLAYAFLHAELYQHGRYLMPLIPCDAAISIAGLLAARRIWLRRERLRRKLKPLAALASAIVVAGTAWRLPAMARQTALNVNEVNTMHVAIGHWVAEHTSPDDLLALNDIGAITYISERPVIDLAGLITPEVVPLLRAPDREDQLAAFLVERGAQHVIIFPEWFPGLAARADLLEPVHEVVLERRTIVGGRRMTIRIGVIGGSGLYQMDGLVDTEERKVSTPFGDPSDAVVIGTLEGARVAFLARHGRGHRITPTEVNYRANIFALKSLGVEQVISISACGSLREDLHPGDVVVPDQVFDFTKRRAYTFFGGGLVTHVGVADPFCPRLSAVVADAVEDAGGTVHRGGRFITIEGPRFSTRGESLTYRAWGMDIIGMTTCPEAFLAREAEMCYAVMAHITDYDVWHETEAPVSVDALIATLLANTRLAQDALRSAVSRLAAGGERDCECGSALATAIITQRDLIPEALKRDLAPIVGKYLR